MIGAETTPAGTMFSCEEYNLLIGSQTPPACLFTRLYCEYVQKEKRSGVRVYLKFQKLRAYLLRALSKMSDTLIIN